MIDPLLRLFFISQIFGAFFRTRDAHEFSLSGDPGDRAFAFPLMVFAQDGLVFFKLAFELGEGLFAAAPGIFRSARSVQRSGRQRQIH